MVVKVAEALSLKRQFGISGLVTAEEIEGASEVSEITSSGRTPTLLVPPVEVVPEQAVE